ncbi:MAG: hypothetical protein V4479_09590 [Actinomycetota bacterium]
MPNFETFEKRRTPPASEPFVTLLKTGVISMNVIAYESLGRAPYLEFLYDKDEKIVGLNPLRNESQFSYPVRELASATGGTFSVSAKAFMLFYGIPMDSSIRRRAYLDGPILCVDLNEPGVDVTSGRTATQD